MPMSPRLLRPIASGVHPEAAAWRNAVIANSGSVSASTVKAVSAFCAEIDAAGIRDRFYRLNLLCGSGLNAVLVPLYRGASRTGTQYGNTTDTNNGPFVSGDYSETTGLDGNGTTKHLDTGVSPDDLPSLATGHLAVYKGAGSAGGSLNAAMIGSRTATQFFYLRQTVASDVLAGNWGGGSFVSSASADTTSGLVVLTRTASTAFDIYKGTSSVASTASSFTPIANANDFVVFNFRGTDGTVSGSGAWPHLILSYSVGASMSSANVSAYNTALLNFYAAIGRTS